MNKNVVYRIYWILHVDMQVISSNVEHPSIKKIRLECRVEPTDISEMFNVYVNTKFVSNLTVKSLKNFLELVFILRAGTFYTYIWVD